MITGLHLENFKCFESLSLSLRKLTLLTGFNAAGKSTSLQTILLLAQTLRSDEKGSELRLNGPLVRLGSAGDVINQRRGGNQIVLGIETEGARIRWQLHTDDRKDRRTLGVASIQVTTSQDTTDYDGRQELHRLLPSRTPNPPASAAVDLLDEAIFVSALRQVDSEVFPTPEDPRPTIGNVGALGEYAAWWFHHFDDIEVPAERRLGGADKARTLRSQVNVWTSEFFPGAEVDVQPVLQTSLMRLAFRIGQIQDWHRPSNVGYGLTYVFPILVAGLCASPSQLLMIDSPEAHLHPHGQSRMGQFLAQAASSGPQLVIETHSDHVLNGIRLALRDGAISPDDVVIHFFHSQMPADPDVPQVTTVSADRKGNLTRWPEGFFDQTDKDLANLAGWN
jgi:predicted ATPase